MVGMTGSEPGVGRPSSPVRRIDSTLRRAIGIGVLATAALCLATLPIVGLGSWRDLVRELSAAVPDCYPWNLSIACALGSSVGITVGTWVGLIVGGLAALALLVVRDRFWMALLAAIAIMAPVTNLHLHYWVVLPVLLIAGLGRYQELRRARLVGQNLIAV